MTQHNVVAAEVENPLGFVPVEFALSLVTFGSGEALNEHILGNRWPAADERLDPLPGEARATRAPGGDRAGGGGPLRRGAGDGARRRDRPGGRRWGGSAGARPAAW